MIGTYLDMNRAEGSVVALIEKYPEIMEWKKVYDASLNQHIEYFCEAATKLGLCVAALEKHDVSKVSSSEYPHYVIQFGGGPRNEPGFFSALNHHYNTNPHHWQHWSIPYGIGTSNIEIDMPKTYIREMLADWMAASKQYSKDGWDVRPWLLKNQRNIVVTPNTAIHLIQIMKDNGMDARGINFGWDSL